MRTVCTRAMLTLKETIDESALVSWLGGRQDGLRAQAIFGTTGNQDGVGGTVRVLTLNRA